jgi:amidase
MQLGHLDATHMAQLVERKEVTPLELVEASIARIEEANPTLNAVVTEMFEHAIEAAKSELPKGPFTGVPFLMKDLMGSYANVRMTLGSRSMMGFIAPHHSELTLRLERAGLVIVGRTNTPELGIVPTTEPRLFGAARNPWALDRTTGGSSGGSAAAVAAGMVPMAHGNDGGGSIRIPASCCGLFGLKPTRGRTPLGPDVGDIMSGLVVEHALTRSVRDSARLLDATCGMDVGAPYTAPDPRRPFADEVLKDPRRLHIAVGTHAPSGVRIDPECVRAVEETAKLLADLGHTVEEAAPELDAAELNQAFITVWASGTAADVRRLEKLGADTSGENLEPLTRALRELGDAARASDYLVAVAHLQSVGRILGRFMVRYDAWLTPTLAEPPIPLGSFEKEGDDLYGLTRAAEFVPFTPLANLSGQPAMSVPLHRTRDNLPVGSHFLGRFGQESTLFALAAQLERARPWSYDGVVC